MASPYISIAGPIGVGKSTLSKALGRAFDYQVFIEGDATDNQFLERYYENRLEFSFISQIFFMNESIKQNYEIKEIKGGAIQDRSAWEHQFIFAKEMHNKGEFKEGEYELLISLFETVEHSLALPDLLIILDAPIEVTTQRIAKRGREYEKALSIKDLEDYLALYRAWADGWTKTPVYVMDTEHFHPESDEDIHNLTNTIKEIIEH